MAAVPFGSVVVQYPVGRFSDAVDRRVVLAGLCLAAGAVAVTGAYALWRLTRRPAPPPEDRSEFHSMLPPSITPVFSDLVELVVAAAGDPERG